MKPKVVRFSMPGEIHKYKGTQYEGGGFYKGAGPYLTNVYALLRKDAPKWAGFTFMPKGDVQ